MARKTFAVAWSAEGVRPATQSGGFGRFANIGDTEGNDLAELLATRTEIELAARTLLEYVEPAPKQDLPAVVRSNGTIVDRLVPDDREFDTHGRGSVLDLIHHEQVLPLELAGVLLR